jgi:hypothetical protein
MPPPGYPPQQPGYGPPPANPPYATNPQQPGEISPKKRMTVILLCLFFGWLGVHRFYLGKIGTGILMLLTLGGLGVWYIVDFFISIFGKYKDSQGRFVAK